MFLAIPLVRRQGRNKALGCPELPYPPHVVHFALKDQAESTQVAVVLKLKQLFYCKRSLITNKGKCSLCIKIF